jgi:toxin YoeB
MHLAFSSRGWEDFQYWMLTDKKKLKKVIDLIDATLRDPFYGIGKPEQLKHQLRGLWSRHIDEEHRLVYEVSANTVIIHQCRFHYQ